MEGKPASPEVNTLKSEHLKEGINPIIACVGTFEEFKKIFPPKALSSFLKGGGSRLHAQDVNFHARPEYLRSLGFKNAGDQTYVISPLNGLDKFSRQYFNCTALVAAGVDKLTKKNISFVSHQNPEDFLAEKKEKFLADLNERLDQLKEKSVEGTIDIVVMGGKFNSEKLEKEYKESIKLLAEAVSKKFGFEPAVISGPKITMGYDSIFYYDKERRLYIVKSEETPVMPAYLPKTLEQEAEKWKAEKTKLEE